MMSVQDQLAQRKLVCPITHTPLAKSEDPNWLVTIDSAKKYPYLNGQIPILIKDFSGAEKYWRNSNRMKREYDPAYLKSVTASIREKLIQDYRSKASQIAFRSLFDQQPANSLNLSIGGGPQRHHPSLSNLNIGPFPNVDIVADAHRLPYGAQSVDAIHCDAVLEHLLDPIQAVREMHRVLKLSGKVYAVTPFLQGFHGYPGHYQNYTLEGHCHLFTSNGFSILDRGTCVGPTYTMASLMSTFLHEYFPGGKIIKYLWGVFAITLRPLDILINPKPNSHFLASTTYLVAGKI
jgi:SAM-dependent methyltransferase